MMARKILFGALASTCLATAAIAAVLPAVGADAIAKTLAAASHDPGLRVTKLFPGPDGLAGAVVHYGNGTDGIVWMTANRKALIPGPIYDSQGNDLSTQAKYEQGVLDTPAEALKKIAAAKSHSIMVGTKGPVLTAFFDANCAYCHLLYTTLEKPVAEGKLRVRYVMVGLIKKSSAGRAAAILAAKDPAAALALDEHEFNAVKEEGGLPEAIKPDPAIMKAIAANGAEMIRAGGMGTPVLLYCTESPDGKGEAAQMASGLTGTADALIAKLTSGPHPGCG